MSDDIVTRLRDNCACSAAFDEFGLICASCTAADEIERLGAELAHAQTEIARLERLATNG